MSCQINQHGQRDFRRNAYKSVDSDVAGGHCDPSKYRKAEDESMMVVKVQERSKVRSTVTAPLGMGMTRILLFSALRVDHLLELTGLCFV